MDVGVGDGRDIVLHRDHHDMRIGLADIVLDHEPVADAGGRRVQAGMVEFQAARAREPAHEGFHRRPVARQQAVTPGAGEIFFRMFGRQPVQGFVQVHHQPVQAVAFVKAGQPAHQGERHAVADVGKVRYGGDRVEPRREGSAFGRAAGAHGVDHRGHVRLDRRYQMPETRRRNNAVRAEPRLADQGFHRRGRESGGATFGGEIERPSRIARLPPRRLKHAEPGLDPLIRREAGRDQRRQQNLGLAQRFEDFRLHARLLQKRHSSTPRRLKN